MRDSQMIRRVDECDRVSCWRWLWRDGDGGSSGDDGDERYCGCLCLEGSEEEKGDDVQLSWE